jgi:endoglucanase
MLQFVKVSVLLAVFACFCFAQNPVECYGKLQAHGNKLVGSKTNSTPVQVRGVSLGWSNIDWPSARFFNATTVNAMVNSWRAEVIRAPLGYSGYGNTGYQGKPTENKNLVKAVVNAAIVKGVYVIIDWHSHNAHSSGETNAAKTFFTEMAREYGNNDHVIFEIYNEPICSNGSDMCDASQRTTWAQIKSYAEKIILAIREHSNNLILVGTPNWSQDVNVVNQSTKINDDNIAYVLHFYAATHALPTFRPKMNLILDEKLPIFVSEWGTTVSDGGQGDISSHDAKSSDAWMAHLDQNKISSAAWNVNDKSEGSSFFGKQNNFNMSSWTNTNMMTESGKYVYKKLTDYYSSGLEWRNCPDYTTPIMNSKTVSSNVMQLINNGVSLQISEAAKLQVFDLRGNLLRIIDLSYGSHFVSLNEFPKGLYIVKISLGSEKKVLRVPVS